MLRRPTDAGFVHQNGLGRDGVAALRRYAGEYILFRNDAMPVEPHWHPSPWTMAFDIDIEALWRRALPADFLGAPCYLPTPEDHLFLLALHGAKEQWHKLKWLVDVAAFLNTHGGLDVSGLRTVAAAQGCRRVLDLALLLSHRLFAVPAAAPPADAVTAALADDVIARLMVRPNRRAGLTRSPRSIGVCASACATGRTTRYARCSRHALRTTAGCLCHARCAGCMCR